MNFTGLSGILLFLLTSLPYGTASETTTIREAWSEEHKSFYLTWCLHSRSAPPAYSSATFRALEAFACEARLTGNQKHSRIMREALRTAISAGMRTLESRESIGQSGYYSGIFLFPPFAFQALEDQ